MRVGGRAEQSDRFIEPAERVSRRVPRGKIGPQTGNRITCCAAMRRCVDMYDASALLLVASVDIDKSVF